MENNIAPQLPPTQNLPIPAPPAIPATPAIPPLAQEQQEQFAIGGMNSYLEKIATHILCFGIFLVLILNLGLFIGVPVTKYVLPIAYAGYLLVILLVDLKLHKKIRIRDAFIAIDLIPILFLLGIFLCAQTYDFTFDGENYHQTAVISLAQGWNPIRDSQLAINAPTGLFGLTGEFSKPFVVGYPKILWLIQSSIYTFTGHINSATVTNAIAAFTAFIFLYYLLLGFNVGRFWSSLIALTAILSPVWIRESLSFMADGFSYEMSLIAITALITLAMNTRDKTRPLVVLLCSGLFLIGTKYSNAYIGLILVVAGIVILLSIISRSPESFKILSKVVLLGIIVGIVVLFEPFAVNWYRQGSPIYPDNFSWATDNIKAEGIPLNLVKDNRLQLFFYGIYSQTQVASASSAPSNVAVLKIPFTIAPNEIKNSSVAEPSGRVAEGGVWFSGVFTLSIILLMLSFIFGTLPSTRKVLMSVAGISALTVLAALTLTTPNILRYTPLIGFIPILILAGIVIINRSRKSKLLYAACYILAACIIINISISSYVFISSTFNETVALDSQLSSMRNSGLTYNVYAPGFYSSYTRLQEAGIKFNETSDLGCKNPKTVDYTYSPYDTKFCPVAN